MTVEGDWVFDPFLGTGTSIIAAIRHKRRGAGAEMSKKYIDLAKQRINQELDGTLKTRPMDKPIYDPVKAGNSLIIAPWSKKSENNQLRLLERQARYHVK